MGGAHKTSVTTQGCLVLLPPPTSAQALLPGDPTSNNSLSPRVPHLTCPSFPSTGLLPSPCWPLHLIMVHLMQRHHIRMRLAEPQGSHFTLCVRLQPGDRGAGGQRGNAGSPRLPVSGAHLRLRILTANSWPLWRWRQRRHTEKLPWPSAGSRRSSSYCWKKGESWKPEGCIRGPTWEPHTKTLPRPSAADLHHGAPGHCCPAWPVSSTRHFQHIGHHCIVVIKQDGGGHEGVSLWAAGWACR